jgi:quaternary ammonium compound-resistance protein SugE
MLEKDQLSNENDISVIIPYQFVYAAAFCCGLFSVSQDGRARSALLAVADRDTANPMPVLNPSAAWAVLLVAGLCEVVWAIGLKYTEGFTRLVPSALTLAAMAGSVILLAWSLKTLPVGTAYAVWTGIGAVGTALLGMLLFNESREVARLVCIGLIVAGILGLKFVTK